MKRRGWIERRCRGHTNATCALHACGGGRLGADANSDGRGSDSRESPLRSRPFLPVGFVSLATTPSPARGESKCLGSTARGDAPLRHSRLHLSNSTSRSRSASRPGPWPYPRPIQGVAERRQAHCLVAALTSATRPVARQDARERAHDAGRSPLGAPPWRFLGSGSALPSAALPPQRVQRAPRGAGPSAWRATPVPPEHCGYEPQPQDATPRSAYGPSPEDAPR
jgi:hypothetical protein